MKDARDLAGVMRRIVDVDIAQRVRALRAREQEEDIWLADAAKILDDLNDQHQEIERVYKAAVRLVCLAREELVDEARRRGVPMERVDGYRKNSIILGRIRTITDYAAAAAFLATVPGVEEITRVAFEEALEEGKKITEERKKKINSQPSDEQVCQRMIPVLFRSEYVEGGEFVQRYFLALHDAERTNSFARKVLQDVKDHLHRTIPPLGHLIAEMEKKITVDNVREFLFAREGDCLIAVAKARSFSNDGRRNYAVLLERRVQEEAIEVLDVVSAGDGPDELVTHIGQTFRYRVYRMGGKLYPELRHIRDHHRPFYKFLLRALANSGWESPEQQWPLVPYPRNWN